MNYKLLHIFRNSPFGRETFFQSIHFCKTIHADLVVYLPKQDKFLMYFDDEAVQVSLDRSYLKSNENAEERVRQLAQDAQINVSFLEPSEFTASSLPDLPTAFDYLCCPRSVSDHYSKIGLGHIGPKVRRIIQQAHFPVLITSPVFKPWTSISVFFGGSNNAVKALKLGLKISLASGLPLFVYTLLEKTNQEFYTDLTEKEGLSELVDQQVQDWLFYNKTDLDLMLYEVQHDSLVVLGAYGHGKIKDFLFGSKMEQVNSTLTNNLLIVGPKSKISLRR